MTYKLSVRAKDDLRKIAVFTLEKWGVDQVGRYLDEMDRTFELLASHPGLGRSAESIRPGLRRFERARHTIFFQLEAERIVISRILHQHQQPSPHRF